MTRRLALILLGLLPWTILIIDGEVEFVFLWGLLTPHPLHGITIYQYVTTLTRGLPDRLLAWPISTLLYSTALANMVIGHRFATEDRRLTAGLLVLAGASHLVFTLGIARRNPAAIALPVGPLVAWAVVWWVDWPVITRAWRGER